MPRTTDKRTVTITTAEYDQLRRDAEIARDNQTSCTRLLAKVCDGLIKDKQIDSREHTRLLSRYIKYVEMVATKFSQPLPFERWYAIERLMVKKKGRSNA